jgi:DnaB helicase-like protein
MAAAPINSKVERELIKNSGKTEIIPRGVSRGTHNRSLPDSLVGEKGVLSCLIQSPPEVAELCSRYLNQDDFYVPAHQIIFAILLELHGIGQVEFPWLKDQLKKNNQLEEVGGDQFLNELYTFTPSAANAKWYIDQVLDTRQRRNVILECRRREVAAFDEKEPAEAFDPEGMFAPKTRLGPEIYSVRQLLDFDRENDPNSLLGNRWLCRGDSLLICGRCWLPPKEKGANQGGRAR